ncbi:MAG: NADH-quinone oxidoreductase subunit J [Pseudomonadota bacterium]|nr:NADH-quinone oxidoreductase subunit J [Pseudomonadota bacterium]
MTLPLILFYAFAAVLIGSALAVISARNSVHAALWLVLTFFTSACIWLLLHAEFLAIVLVLVYVGAVMVLFLFVVMMLDVKVEPTREGFIRHLPVGLLVAGVMLVEMLGLIGVGDLNKSGGLVDAAAAQGLSNTHWLGRAMFSEYILPFEIAAVILTVAIIAAVALTLRHRPSQRSQDPAQQAAVRSQDRMRIVDIPSATSASRDKP